MRKALSCVIIAGLTMVLGAQAHALTYTFDNGAGLTDNFNLDVVAGDFGTDWRAGYGPFGGYPGSDGGFVHFNWYNQSNSIQFKSGPVFLNSFDISSQYSGGGAGVSQADLAMNDYHLKLFDASFEVLYDERLFVAEGGIWETLVFNLEGVSTIWIAGRSSDGTGTGGWWPNLDNIVVNQTVTPIPLPGAFPLFAAGLGALWLMSRRRRSAST